MSFWTKKFWIPFFLMIAALVTAVIGGSFLDNEGMVWIGIGVFCVAVFIMAKN